MSITESFTKRSEPGSEAVLDHFFIGPDQTTEAYAMRLVFNHMHDNVYENGIHAFALMNASIALTIEEIEFPYYAMKEYAEGYLGSSVLDDDLIAAVICGHCLSDDATLEWLKERDLSEKVATLYEEAEEIRQGLSGDFSRKGRFLAYILSLEELENLSDKIDYCAEIELLTLRQTGIPNMLKFIESKTEIGKELKYQTRLAIGMLDSQIAQIRNGRETNSSTSFKPQIIKADFPLHALRPEFQDATNYDGPKTKDFGIESVFEILSIEPREPLERAAIRFVYEELYKQETGTNAIRNREEALNKTIDIVEDPYFIVGAFSSNFLGNNFHKDALTLAAICDDLVCTASFRACPSFDRGTVKFAEMIWHEATQYGLNGQSDKMTYPEAHYLCHVFGLVQLKYAFENMHAFEDEEDFDGLISEILAMQSFIQPETDIGQELQKQMDTLARHLDRIPDEDIRHKFQLTFAANDEPGKYINSDLSIPYNPASRHFPRTPGWIRQNTIGANDLK